MFFGDKPGNVGEDSMAVAVELMLGDLVHCLADTLFSHPVVAHRRFH